MAKSREGGCVCGAVRYRVNAAPQVGLVCHCTWCQKRSGSAFASIAYFNEADVEFQGRMTMYEHRSDETGRWLRIEFRRAATRAAGDFGRDDGGPRRLSHRPAHLGAVSAAVGDGSGRGRGVREGVGGGYADTAVAAKTVTPAC